MSVEKDVVISHPEGLHARPAASLVRLAKAYSGNITLNWDNQVIDAKSILDILSAGIDCGDVINLAVDGEDAKEMMDKLVRLLTSGAGK
jgi:phosphocarrier protein